jgi:hypothetical protein
MFGKVVVWVVLDSHGSTAALYSDVVGDRANFPFLLGKITI